MCGLFGWNFKRKSGIEIGKRECMASVLACANSLRGDKSWGVYVSGKQGCFVRREVGDISEAANFGQFGRYPLVMGHTRLPTSGRVCEKNAHPFTVGKITLAHNGTISNTNDLDRKHNRKVRVDSQHFAYHLSEGKDFSDIEGYGAIEWNEHDMPNRVYMCRLRSGSLRVYGIKNPSGDTVGYAWSSDTDHLRGALGAARLNSFPVEPMDEGIVHFVENGEFFYVKGDENKLVISEPKWKGYNSTQGHPAPEDRGYWISRTDGEWTWVPKPIVRDSRITVLSERNFRNGQRQLGNGSNHLHHLDSEDEESVMERFMHQHGFHGFYGGE